MSKPQFAAVPVRAIGDPELTDGDLRVLAAVAAFDRLSHARGTGQGSWASHQTLARWLGRNYTALSATIHKLLELGYLIRERREADRRQFTYRVVYTDDDRVPSAEQVCLPTNNPSEDVCPTANDPAEIVHPAVHEAPDIVHRDDDENHENSDASFTEYIPRSGGINSVETGERNSVETAHRAKSAKRRVRENGQFDRVGNPAQPWLEAEADEPGVAGMLARLERAFKADPASIGDIAENITWLETIAEAHSDDNGPVYQRANRMLEEFESYQRERGR